MSKFNDLINGDVPVLVDFHADWCGPCKMQAPILKQLSSEIAGKAKIIKVDVDKNQQAAMKYGIRSVPTLMMFKKGQIVWQQSGVAQLAQLKGLVEQHG